MASLSALESELKKYKERKKAVDKVINDIFVNQGLAYNISNCISYSSGTRSDICSAFNSEVKSIAKLAEAINEIQEKYLLYDIYLPEVKENLDSESSRCNNEIARLKDEIAALKSAMKNSAGS